MENARPPNGKSDRNLNLQPTFPGARPEQVGRRTAGGVSEHTFSCLYETISYCPRTGGFFVTYGNVNVARTLIPSCTDVVAHETSRSQAHTVSPMTQAESLQPQRRSWFSNLRDRAASFCCSTSSLLSVLLKVQSTPIKQAVATFSRVNPEKILQHHT